MTDIPLGKTSTYPDRYTPELLASVPRVDARAALDIDDELPFTGVDLWNAWELSWLLPGGKPAVAVAEIKVPVDSPNLIESKSLKLYLNSFAMSEYASIEALSKVIESDLSRTAGSAVGIQVTEGPSARFDVAPLPGRCIDALEVSCEAGDVDPALLTADSNVRTEEALHCHLLRSLCPVTSQPDFGSVLVEYSGPRIDAVGLLGYIVSFRQHQDFHEACVERMFMDIRRQCRCDALSVSARYTRRGGIDINPCRSTTRNDFENLRVWRQ